MKKVIVMMATIISAVILLNTANAFKVEKNVVMCVQKKEHKQTSYDSIVYDERFVVTSNDERLDFRESVLQDRTKESSIEDFDKIKEGQCYSATVQGISLPDVKVHRNVLNYE